MTKANECTCPSGDGSLRWPCPKHPAVEHERAEFEAWVRRDWPGAPLRFIRDALPVNDPRYGQYCDDALQRAWVGWQARAALSKRSKFRQHLDECADEVATWPSYKREALAQPSPVLPPFAEKVLAKLRRFNECAEDPGSGGVDIGRHWLDLLTQLGLLNRVQRSPALWEITQQGEDLLGTSQPSPAPELAERGTQHRFSTTEQTCRHDFAGVWWNDNGETKTGRECRHCGFFVADVTEAPAEQAEAERPEVAEVAFVLRNIGAMDAEDIDGDNVDLRFEDAEGRDTGCDVSIVEYAEKAADLFEQHDRIVGALRAENAKLSEALDECDGDRWKLRSERDAANARLHEVATACATAEQERDAALARVAELEMQEPVALANRGLHAFWVKWTEAAAGLYGPGIKLYAAPVAQAQQLHDLDKQCRDDVARALGLRPNQGRGFAWSYLLASIKSCVKASEDSAQAQHSVPGDIMRDAQRYRWLRDQQFYFSFSTENSDAGISSCTAGMSSRFKNLSWVDAAIDSAIAAAPGKEGV
ncbi:hypothetical protein [Pseudomonas aeruginosa]